MTSRRLRVKYRLLSVWKLCLSCRKSDWDLTDYPVVVREQEAEPAYAGTRCRVRPYMAFIVNWGLAGVGDSEAEALDALKDIFNSVRTERAETSTPMPRPGTRVPIHFSSQVRVKEHPVLADDFIRRILELDWAWISDESSLWDFHHEETNEALISKVKEIYGVDVSDIQSAKIADILKRISMSQECG